MPRKTWMNASAVEGVAKSMRMGPAARRGNTYTIAYRAGGLSPLYDAQDCRSMLLTDDCLRRFDVAIDVQDLDAE
jgi:hypothetical protein